MPSTHLAVFADVATIASEWTRVAVGRTTRAWQRRLRVGLFADTRRVGRHQFRSDTSPVVNPTASNFPPSVGAGGG